MEKPETVSAQPPAPVEDLKKDQDEVAAVTEEEKGAVEDKENKEASSDNKKDDEEKEDKKKDDNDVVFIQDTGFTVKIVAPNLEPFDIQARTFNTVF